MAAIDGMRVWCFILFSPFGFVWVFVFLGLGYFLMDSWLENQETTCRKDCVSVFL